MYLNLDACSVVVESRAALKDRNSNAGRYISWVFGSLPYSLACIPDASPRRLARREGSSLNLDSLKLPRRGASLADGSAGPDTTSRWDGVVI